MGTIKMTPVEFKKRWESTENGDGMTFDDIADCAKEWGIALSPRTCNIDIIRYRVLQVAGTIDCEEFNPQKEGTQS